MTTITSIAVIGAGLAGLACAKQLQAAGLSVTVFEKSRGIGGRLCTRRGADWQADHGAQYFTARSPAFREQVEAWLAAGVVADWSPAITVFGAPLSHPQDTPVRYVGVPGMSAPAKALADGLLIRNGYTVKQLEQDEAGWRIATVEHGWLDERYSGVIVAVPAPQAVPLLATISPTLAGVAERTRMTPSWTLLAQFDERVALPFDAAFVNEGPLRWLARNSSKPARQGQESWVIQATGVWSEAHLEDSPENVVHDLLEAFRQLGGPEPLAVSAHRWRYADCAAASVGSVWDSGLKVGLCGDWLHGGKVEGAWLSGRHLAATLLDSLND